MHQYYIVCYSCAHCTPQSLVTVESERGKGATFHIFLPQATTKPEADATTPKPILRGSERILFIDDEPILVKATKESLRYLGYRVVSRTSSVEALELFQKNPGHFDLVITDIIMPGLTGDRLAIEMMKIRKDIPIILCTGYSEHMTEEKAKELGIRGFIMKPSRRPPML